MTLGAHGELLQCAILELPDLAEQVKRGDIVIAAAGRAHMITVDMIKPGAVVIDVGINELEGKTVGDVDYEAVKILGLQLLQYLVV